WHLDAARTLASSGAPVHRVARQLLWAMRQSHVETFDERLTRWLVNAAPSLVAQSPSLAVELLRTAVSGPPTAENPHGVLSCRLADALFRTGDIAAAERVAARTESLVTNPDLVIDLQ